MNLAFLHVYSDLALLVLRLIIGAIFLVHGYKKTAMWKMTPSAQMPSGMLNLMRFLSVAEIASALGVIFGVLTGWAALGLICIMLGAMYKKIFTWKKSFAADGGWELDLIIFGACLVLVILGAGTIIL